VVSNAECDQHNLAHVARKKKLKQTDDSAHLVQCSLPASKIREGSREGTRKIMEERICERFLSHIGL